LFQFILKNLYFFKNSKLNSNVEKQINNLEDQFKIYCENEDICMLSNGTTNFYDLEDMINKWNNRT
jgi:hypothetical protein